ncbi:MAG: hypothetical protein MJA30_02565 [Cytophagales bacterium]|nr:hypothetical protein [Cytophagales bacterium]
MNFFIIKYSGPFGFIKPWTAVRDSETFSQQFLTPSIVEGMEKKLFPELLSVNGIHKILRHRINYCGISSQQERTWSKGGIKVYKDKHQYKTNMGILNRGVMLCPNLYLAFKEFNDAERAYSQTICLCRNEDLLYPEQVEEMTPKQFNDIPGFELLFSDAGKGFKVGYNRFDNGEPMFGELKVYGNPIRNDQF